MTDTPPPPPPPSIRRGTPRDIAAISRIRNHGYHMESFASFLAGLDESQADLLHNEENFKKNSLYHQMDILDALFVYMTIAADKKTETPQSYMTALRSQRQFCGQPPLLSP